MTTAQASLGHEKLDLSVYLEFAKDALRYGSRELAAFRDEMEKQDEHDSSCDLCLKSARACIITINPIRCEYCGERRKTCSQKKRFLVWAAMRRFRISSEYATELYNEVGQSLKAMVPRSLTSAPALPEVPQVPVHRMSASEEKDDNDDDDDDEGDISGISSSDLQYALHIPEAMRLSAERCEVLQSRCERAQGRCKDLKARNRLLRQESRQVRKRNRARAKERRRLVAQIERMKLQLRRLN